MIKIETRVVENEPPIQDILMEYETEDVKVGEYIAILDKIKNEVLENTNIDKETLKDILFGKED